MASVFLLREGSKLDFDSINLRIRELGFQNEDEILYLGTTKGNKHIPNEEYVSVMIDNAIGRKVTKTVLAETNSLFSVMVFKLVSFNYIGESVVSYTGLDFASFSMDADGNYTEINPPVKRDGVLYIPSGFTVPVSGENVVAAMKEGDATEKQYFCTLNSSGVMTIYLETSGQVAGEKGIFTVMEPEASNTGFPATVEQATSE